MGTDVRATPAAGVEAHRMIFLAACLAVFMVSVEATIVATAIPTIVGDLGGLRLFSWVFGIYLLTQAVTIPIYGRLADIYGRRALIFVSITAASYDGIPPDKTGQASGLINAARNTGGSIGVSIAANVLTHREQFHQSRLIEHVTPSSPQYQSTLQQVTHYFALQGFSPGDAQARATAWIGQQVQNQSAYLSYVDVFWVLMLLSLAAVPLAMSLRKVKLGGGRAPAAH